MVSKLTENLLMIMLKYLANPRGNRIIPLPLHNDDKNVRTVNIDFLATVTCSMSKVISCIYDDNMQRT